MNRDAIVEEVRRVREQHAAEFNYDVEAIFDDLKRRETLRDAQESPLLNTDEAPIAPPGGSPRHVRFARH